MRTPDHKRPVPRAIERARTVQGRLATVVIVATWCFIFFASYGRKARVPGSMAIGVTLAFLAAGAGTVVWRNWRIASLKRRAAEYGGLLCDNCTYDLRGADVANLHDGGTPAPTPAPTCPECGEPFTPQGLRERWGV